MIRVLIVGIIFSTALLSHIGFAAEPPTTLEITIPDYVVTTSGGVHYAEIPGGEILLFEEGRPRVPYYVTSIDYPEGWRVQDVTLEERSGLTTTTGLRLPVVILSDKPASQVEMIGGWYPEEDFDWRLWDNGDGSTKLDIVVYPFCYNADTTEVRFYKNYKFSIECVPSTVAITGLVSDKYDYESDEPVIIDVMLNNSGETQDIVAGLVIKRYGSDVIIDGLPLRLLRNLSGDASLSVEWDIGNTEPGYYYVEATITDTMGNILDKETAGFGIRSPETTTKPTEFPTVYVAIGLVVAIVVLTTLFVIIRRKTSPK